MNTQFFTNNGNQKFPLSTEALNFMQEQIKLAYGLTDLAGENIIVRQSSATETGLVIFDGELLPLTGNPSKLITIAESTEQMYVEGFAGNVRTTRKAIYTNIKKATIAGSSSKTKLASDFTVLKNISTLMSELDEAKKHVMPKGSIIDWYGTCQCSSIPYGYVPCGRFFTGSSYDSGKRDEEIAKWKARYSSITITNGNTSNGSTFSILITQCNGQTVPDLTDRFVVQAGNIYELGNTGGYNTVSLQPQHLPSHKHEYTKVLTNNEGGDWLAQGNGVDKQVRRGYSNTGSGVYNNDNELKTSAGNNGTAHENRPPYYALCYLIKVI